MEAAAKTYHESLDPVFYLGMNLALVVYFVGLLHVAWTCLPGEGFSGCFSADTKEVPFKDASMWLASIFSACWDSGGRDCLRASAWWSPGCRFPRLGCRRPVGPDQLAQQQNEKLQPPLSRVQESVGQLSFFIFCKASAWRGKKLFIFLMTGVSVGSAVLVSPTRLIPSSPINMTGHFHFGVPWISSMSIKMNIECLFNPLLCPDWVRTCLFFNISDYLVWEWSNGPLQYCRPGRRSVFGCATCQKWTHLLQFTNQRSRLVFTVRKVLLLVLERLGLNGKRFQTFSRP